MSEVQKKSWWQSTTIIGGATALIAGIAGAFELDAAGISSDLGEIIAGVVAAVGGVISIIGRFRARKQIGGR